MNDKDKEVFERHIQVVCNKENDYERFYAIWKSACEYKNKEINNLKSTLETLDAHDEMLMRTVERLKAENAKLRECVEFYADLNDEVSMYDSRGVTEARQILKELKNT